MRSYSDQKKWDHTETCLQPVDLSVCLYFCLSPCYCWRPLCCLLHTFAFIPAVACVPADAFVRVDPGIPILAVVFANWLYCTWDILDYRTTGLSDHGYRSVFFSYRTIGISNIGLAKSRSYYIYPRISDLGFEYRTIRYRTIKKLSVAHLWKAEHRVIDFKHLKSLQSEESLC